MASHPADLSDEELLRECDQRFDRRSGPGGQHRNKVETAAIVTHRRTGITAEANERRSQSTNRTQALFRLRLRLATELRVERPRESVPSLAWRERIRNGPLRVSRQHPDFPRLLAEALDLLAQNDFHPALAASELQCSPSQLIRLCRLYPPALRHVNDERVTRGLHILR